MSKSVSMPGWAEKEVFTLKKSLAKTKNKHHESGMPFPRQKTADVVNGVPRSKIARECTETTLRFVKLAQDMAARSQHRSYSTRRFLTSNLPFNRGVTQKSSVPFDVD